MADATLKQVIKALQDQTAVKMQSDDEQTQRLVQVRDEITDVKKMFQRFFVAQKASEGDRLEEKREKRNVKDQVQRSKAKSGSSSGFGLGDFGLGAIAAALPKMILPLTGGLIALGAAFAGLRGWELSAIKALDPIRLVPDSIVMGIKNMRVRALAIFGLSPEGTVGRNAKGQFERVPPISEQIRMRLNALRIRALRIFGLGVDGKPITLKGDDGLFKKNFIGRVTFQINRLLKPLMNVADGVADFAGGAGRKLFGFISSNITGGVKVVGTLVKRLLWPIGFIFSLFDGIKAYQESDAEGFIGKLGDGVGGFLGSLIGAPFDLLKNAINWIWDKAFDIKRDENGNVTSEGWASWVSKKMEEFSFQELIQSIVSAPFKVFDGILTFATDPVRRAEMIESGKQAIINFGAGLADFIVGSLPNFEGIKTYVKDRVRDLLGERAYNYLFPPDDMGYSGRGAGGMSSYNADRNTYLKQQQKAASMNLNAFAGFDANNSGFLTQNEIRKALGGKRSEEFLQTLMSTGLVGSGRSADVISRDLMKGMYFDDEGKPVKFGRTGIDVRNLNAPQTDGAGAGFNMMDNRTFNSPQTTNSMTLAMESAVDTTIEP